MGGVRSTGGQLNACGTFRLTTHETLRSDLSYSTVPDLAIVGETCRDFHRVDKTERRLQILTNARDVFARRGYHAAKIDEIVACAGIARGTFYLYFHDKRAIFEEIVDNAFVRLGEAVVRVDTEDPRRPVSDQIEENIRRIVHVLEGGSDG